MGGQDPNDVDPNGGIYLHVPFCSAICPYCDFAVTTGQRDARRNFARTLRREIELWRGTEGVFDTIYFGGGTPSALEDEDLGEIVDSLRRAVAFAADTRISLEVNPEDVDDARIAAWKSLGVHTISLGVQSFDDDELRFLGRRHNGAQARAALTRCLEADFDCVSIDFIFGLPTQSADRIERLVDVAREHGPMHVSCYQLTVHEGTPFHKQRESGRLTELAESEQASHFERWHDSLASAGYEAYEVSNFAREPRYRSRHNQKYWRHVDYLGFGPSAHSFRGVERWWNERELGAYTQRVEEGLRPIAGRESLSPSDLALEALMLQLRTTDGIDVPSFAASYGVDLESHNAETFRDLETRELAIYREGNSIRLTRRGLAVADGIVRDLILPEI